jgi:ketosteroid isomerase-like protein
MADARVDIFHKAAHLFSEGDWEALSELYAPDALVLAPPGWPESGPFRGRDAALQQFIRLREDWEECAMTIENVAGAGDWTLAELHWVGRGAASGVPLDMSLVGAYRVEGGMIAEAHFHWTWEDALADLGIADPVKLDS